MRRGMVALGIAALCGAAGQAQAQVAWDSPMLIPPGAGPEWGIYLLDTHRGGIGVLGTWRSPTAPPGLGLRFGVSEGSRGGVAVLGGLDFDGRLTRATAEFPLDIDWLFGAGLGVDRWTRLSFPAGLTLGRGFTGDGVTFLPYASPRIVLDARIGRRAPSGMDLGFALDLGLDLGFAPGWRVRFGGTLGDRSAVAIGVAFD